MGWLQEMGWRPVLTGLVVLVIAAVSGWGMAKDRAFAPVRAVRWWLARVILPNLRRGWWGRTGFIFLNNASTCALLIVLGGLAWGAWIGIVVVGLAMGMSLRLLGEGDLPEVASLPTTRSGNNEGANRDRPTGPTPGPDDAEANGRSESLDRIEDPDDPAAPASAESRSPKRDEASPATPAEVGREGGADTAEQHPIDRAVAVGMALNLLEVPAILITLGLSMGRGGATSGLLSGDVWTAYAVAVAPLLLIAAGGEALWLGRRPLI